MQAVKIVCYSILVTPGAADAAQVWHNYACDDDGRVLNKSYPQRLPKYHEAHALLNEPDV